jgi:hypothetical protein
MPQQLERIALKEVPRLLERHLGVSVHARVEPGGQDRGIDMIAETPRGNFLVEVKSAAAGQNLHGAIQSLRNYLAHHHRRDIPLLVVPYMGERGRELCREAGVHWMDLSGNAVIRTDRILVDVQGRPNGFLRRGRPSSAFAPKSARVTRFLLQDPKTGHRQREIARATALDEGYVSRIVRRLMDDDLLSKGTDGRLEVRDPDRLLEAWAEAEDFTRHRIQRGFIAAKSGQELIDRMNDALAPSGNQYAFTGLAGAWLLTGFATFRVTTVFVLSPPSPAVLTRAGFLDEPKGANCWVVVPRDEGVFLGLHSVHDVPCASPVQVYVDLKDHPERAKEAAEEVRRRAVPWRTDASEA